MAISDFAGCAALQAVLAMSDCPLRCLAGIYQVLPASKDFWSLSLCYMSLSNCSSLFNVSSSSHSLGSDYGYILFWSFKLLKLLIIRASETFFPKADLDRSALVTFFRANMPF